MVPVEHNGKLTLLSHAGLNPSLVPAGDAVTVDYIKNLNHQISDKFAAGTFDPYIKAGRGRGGRGMGGVTWQDWRTEFAPLAGVRQIVGHTPQPEPVFNDENLCLDTHLYHVALMDTETGELKVEKFDRNLLSFWV